MNARFWIWTVSGWVKITMRPGESLGFSRGGETDEGWHWECETYYHDGDSVQCQMRSEGRDCDGRIDHFWEGACPLENLSARDMELINPCAENIGIFAPEWQRVSAGQRDYQAEAAGY